MIHYPYDLEFVSYNRSFPNLCRGDFRINLYGKEWVLKLQSGGTATCYGATEHIVRRPWTIYEDLLSDDFPRDLIPAVLLLAHKHVPMGCCGGCI